MLLPSSNLKTRLEAGQGGMAENKDKLLSNAGGLLMAAGGIAAFTGGTYGLSQTNPSLVVLSVLLLMGYGVVGYLLMLRGRAFVQPVMPAVAFLVLATIYLFQAQMPRLEDEEATRFLLQPILTLLLAFAGGALLTHVVEETTRRVQWPGKGSPTLNALLHVAAYSPVWNAFTLVALMGNASTALFRLVVIGGSVLVAVACVVGGYAASRRSHPAFTVVGAGLGFVASVLYLFQFMLGNGDADIRFFGQFNALLGLMLTGLPMAIATVAWLQVTTAAPRDPTLPEPSDEGVQAPP